MRVEKPSGKKLFGEEQQFRQSWIWFLLIAIMMVAVTTNIFAFREAHDLGSTSAWISMGIGVSVPIFIMIFLSVSKLDTVITDDGIYFRWWPFRKTYKEIRFDEISKLTIKERIPLKLGSNYVIGYGWVHQVRGREGVEIMTGGNRLWLGTQRLQAFLYAVEKAGESRLLVEQ